MPNFMLVSGIAQSGQILALSRLAIMKSFELNMFELDLNTDLRHVWCVFLLVRVTYFTFFIILHIMTL